MIVVATFRIPSLAVRAFAEYEASVLPLLGEYGGRLRERGEDGTTVVHDLEFPDRAAYLAYRGDPRLVPRRSLLDAAGVRTEVTEDPA